MTEECGEGEGGLARVVTLLETMVVPDPRQAAIRDRMLAFAAIHPDALLRTCAEGHFTASALVVDPASEQVLVLFHTKLRKWLQPGGHADGDADLAAAAWREATEETGIEGLVVLGGPVDLDIHEVRPPAEDAHLHLDVRYVVLSPTDSIPHGNHESEELRWVGLDELPVLGADEGLQRLARRGVRTVRGERDSG